MEGYDCRAMHWESCCEHTTRTALLACGLGVERANSMTRYKHRRTNLGGEDKKRYNNDGGSKGSGGARNDSIAALLVRRPPKTNREVYSNIGVALGKHRDARLSAARCSSEGGESRE